MHCCKALPVAAAIQMVQFENEAEVRHKHCLSVSEAVVCKILDIHAFNVYHC